MVTKQKIMGKCNLDEVNKISFTSPFNRNGVAVILPDADIVQAVMSIQEMLWSMIRHDYHAERKEVVVCKHIFVPVSRWDEFLYELKAR
jgi:hypothetical protein